jgi:hypothetical protein
VDHKKEHYYKTNCNTLKVKNVTKKATQHWFFQQTDLQQKSQTISTINRKLHAKKKIMCLWQWRQKTTNYSNKIHKK